METHEYTNGQGVTIRETVDEDGTVINRQVIADGVVAIGNMRGKIHNWD
ncbi:hypothetical protein [Saccharopolyspora griseoalba]|uniref:Uncharacterized protein n=1 Tax=Saccharopolyspora griseoalba TaxID=1431848 RepID=A0ABW2LQR5_9PSEU